ncbi:hypothetical protein [Mycobacterium sp. 155]|nr:hypothetical protein [Mycobacterium sp. 155]
MPTDVSVGPGGAASGYLLILDESTASLDVSTKSRVLDLFIAHDLAVCTG